MYYGDEKVRQMIRSLLPSASRVGARNDKRAVKKASKAKNRALLRGVVNSVVDCDTLVMDNDSREVRMVVQNRRNADKVGPFINWVTARTRDMRQEDRKSYVKGLVPDNTIGQHAMTHLPRQGFDHPNVDYVNSLPKPMKRYRYNSQTKRVEPYIRERDLSYDEYRTLIVRVLEFGMHAALNKSIEHHTATKVVGYKSFRRADGTLDRLPITQTCGPTRPRLLLGWHDIDPFLRDLFRGHGDGFDYKRDGTHHPEWRKSMDKFLHKNRDVLRRR